MSNYAEDKKAIEELFKNKLKDHIVNILKTDSPDRTHVLDLGDGNNYNLNGRFNLHELTNTVVDFLKNDFHACMWRIDNE